MYSHYTSYQLQLGEVALYTQQTYVGVMLVRLGLGLGLGLGL